MLELRNVSYEIHRKGESLSLLNDVSLKLGSGHFMAVVGPSGCGKTTLIKLIAGLYEESRDTNFFVTTDIDEAIYLADRLLIMTNLPTSTRKVLQVDVPRPRSIDDLADDKVANDIKIEVMTLLHEEAMKSFKTLFI